MSLIEFWCRYLPEVETSMGGDHPGCTPRVSCWAGEGGWELSSHEENFQANSSPGGGERGGDMKGQGYPNSVREPGSGYRQQEVGIFTFKIISWFLSVEHSVLTIIHLNPISDFPPLDSPTNVAHFLSLFT